MTALVAPERDLARLAELEAVIERGLFVELAMALVAAAEAIARLEAAAATPHLPVVALARRMRVHALLLLGGHLADPADAA